MWGVRGIPCLVLIALITSSPLAQAADAESDADAARRHFTRGSKDFDLGRYDDAIKEYMAAYDAKPDPALLYNIAQVHKLAGHIAEAIRFYRVYLMKMPDASNAYEVRAKIAELQKALDQQQKAQAMPPDVVKPLGSLPVKQTVVVEPSDVTPATTAPPATAPATTSASAPEVDVRPARGAKIAGFTLAAGGLALVGVGIGLSVIAQQDANQLTATDRQGGVFDRNKDDTGRTFGVVGPVLIGVGAAVAVVGGVVVGIAYRRAHHHAAATALLPRSTSVSSRGAFQLAF